MTVSDEKVEILYQGKPRDRLEALINEANKYVFLVSPYVTLDKLRNLERAVLGALSRKVKVKLVVRARDVSTTGPDVLTSESIRKLVDQGLELRLLRDLHAKVYLSENGAILTSLNLLDSSFNNSIEIGAAFSADSSAYRSIVEFLKTEVQPTSELVTELPKPAKISVKSAKKADSPIKTAKPALDELFDADEDEDAPFGDDEDDDEEGVCIRCGDELPYDTEKPLCRACYGVWKKHEDPNYAEKFCHRCGDATKTSLAKPLCRECWSAQ